MIKNKPNLFLVGAMKSATTSLHNYLDVHPEIFMTQDPWKEPNYFVEELNYNKGLDWYSSLFDNVQSEKVIGESSTDYTKAPNYRDTHLKLHQFNPNAKILYVMRDPIERAISQYWWEVEYSAEGRDMKHGILENDWIMNCSYYAQQIKPYIDVFGRENVYTLTAEELISEPNRVMKEIFEWLGVSTDIQLKDETLKVHNQSKSSVNRVMGAGLLSKLKGGVVWDILKKVIPPTLKWKLMKLLSRKVDKDSSGKELAIEAIQPIMKAQTAELSQLLGRDFPEWKTLNRQ